MKKYVLLAAALGIIPTVVHSRVCQIKPPPGECPNPCINTLGEIDELLSGQLTIPGWEVMWQGGGKGVPGSRTASEYPIPYQPNFATGGNSNLAIQQGGQPNEKGKCLYFIEYRYPEQGHSPKVGEFFLQGPKSSTKR